MKFFLYFITVLLMSTMFLGEDMKIVTTLKTFDLSFDSQKSISPNPKDIGRVHVNFKPTEIVSETIPLIKETITKTSPYKAIVYFHNKSKDIEIQDFYFLIDDEKVNIDKNVEFTKSVDDIFIFKSKDVLLDIDVDNLKELIFIVKYQVGNKEAEAKHIYTIYFTEETGNRLWWAIMSV